MLVINGNVYRIHQTDELNITKWSAAQRHDPPSVPARSMMDARGCYVKCDQEFLNGTYAMVIHFTHTLNYTSY